MPSVLVDLRYQIDALDQKIIASLMTTGENMSCPIMEITNNEKGMLQKTGLIFSTITWSLIKERLDMVKEIGQAKLALGITEFVDETRRKQVLASRVEWSPEQQKQQVQKLYEIIHDISVRIQKEGKNLL